MSELKTAIAAMLQAKFTGLALEAKGMGFTVTFAPGAGFAVEFEEGAPALPAPRPAAIASAPEPVKPKGKSLLEPGDACPVCEKGTINRNGNCAICRQREYARDYAKRHPKK